MVKNIFTKYDVNMFICIYFLFKAAKLIYLFPSNHDLTLPNFSTILLIV